MQRLIRPAIRRWVGALHLGILTCVSNMREYRPVCPPERNACNGVWIRRTEIKPGTRRRCAPRSPLPLTLTLRRRQVRQPLFDLFGSLPSVPVVLTFAELISVKRVLMGQRYPVETTSLIPSTTGVSGNRIVIMQNFRLCMRSSEGVPARKVSTRKLLAVALGLTSKDLRIIAAIANDCYG